MADAIGYYIFNFLVGLLFLVQSGFAIYALYTSQAILISSSKAMRSSMEFRNNFLRFLTLCNFSKYIYIYILYIYIV